MKSLPIYMLFCLLVLSCTSSKQLIQETDGSTAATQIPNNFEISSTWANPIGNNAINSLGAQGGFGPETSGGRINISGNTNYVRKTGDSLSIYLPYYGTRTTGATPIMNTTNAAIRFEGIPENYEVAHNGNKDRTQITFDITDNNGRHSFLIKVFKNKNVTIYVNATHRSRIQYEGILSLLEE